MIRKVKKIYPQANIVPIDYDPSATQVNQENRIKLMLAVARECAASSDQQDQGQGSPSSQPAPAQA